jgi:hypothetical protein
MDDLNFKRQLNTLIEQIEQCRNDPESTPSYRILIEQLSSLTLININSKKGLIMHFLVDSYNGNGKIAAQVGEFISLYTKRKRM